MKSQIFVPVDRKLYDDVVRLSNGRFDLIEFAIAQFHDFIRMTEEDDGHGIFGERFEEFLAIYHPDVLADRKKRTEPAVDHTEMLERLEPMVWKDVIIPGGSQVRMQYDGAYHYARVIRSKITDDSGEYSPSEWASKTAAGTNRNAWRDLWFRVPGRKDWVSAMILREESKKKMATMAEDFLTEDYQ